MRNLALFACTASASLLAAQQQPPQQQPAQQQPAAMPAGPLVHIDVLGPAVWRERFLPTNFGSMLASAEGEKVWGPLVAQLDAVWSKAEGEPFAAARQRLLAFAGSTEVLVWADPTGRPGRSHWSGMLIVAPAGTETLDLLAADTARWFAALRTAEPAGVQTIGGEEFEVCRFDGGVATTPVQRDHRIVAFFADHDLASAVTSGKAWLAAGHPARPKPAPPLRIDIDLAQTARLAGDDKSGRAVYAALGLHALGTLSLTLTAEGPSVLGELALLFGPGERGLFAGLFPVHDGVPSRYGLVPKDSTAWKVGRCDSAAIWRAIVWAIAAGSDKTEEQVIAEAKGECGGVELGKDVLSLLTDEALLLWQPRRTEQGESRDDFAFCIAIPVKDPVAFKPVFVKLLREGAKLEVEDEHGEVRAAQKQEWFFPPYQFGLGNGIAVFAVGKTGGDLLDAVLHEAAARPEPPVTAPPRITQLRRTAPDGWNGAGVIDIDSLLRYQLGIFFDLLDELGHVAPMEGEHAARMMEPLRPLLQKHQLTHVVTLSGSTKDCWRFRMLW
ncbi:MAG TPA: hypothetical protein VK348_14945 [Planctomycetota bacterium]|nr:hypothetical protein [Planctomycetota bacterium]